jgi:hypothetical protein
MITFVIQLLSSSIGISIATEEDSTNKPELKDFSNQQTRYQMGTRQSSWSTLKMWNDNKILNVVEVGDVDHTHPGSEIVVGGESNKLTVIYGFGDIWVEETAYVPKPDDWIITSIAIGDVYPHHPGNEIIMVGWSNYVTMVYKSTVTNKWVSERLYEAENWLYDVAIGDIDPTHPGDEIVTCGDPHHVIMLNYSNETDTWSNKLIWKNTGVEISIIAIGDFDRFHNGSELVAASVYVNLINLTEIYYDNSTGRWKRRDMGKLEKEPLEMVIGDFYSGHDGSELALVSIQRNVLMVHQGNSKDEWLFEKLWRDSESIQDVVVADIIEEDPGFELVVAGYSDTVTLLKEPLQESSPWQATRIFSGSPNIINLGAGEFDSFHSGLEIVFLEALKENGRVQKLHRDNLGFNLFTPQQIYAIPAGETISVPIILSSEGGFSEEVTLSGASAQQLESKGVSLNFNQTQALPSSVIELMISTKNETTNDDYKIEIFGEAQSLTGTETINITLSVLPSKTPTYNFSMVPKSDSVVADFSKSFNLISNSINSWDKSLNLKIRYLPPGVSYSFGNPVITPPESTHLTLTTTSSTPPGTYFIIISSVSDSDSSYQFSTILVLDVQEPKPDFRLGMLQKEFNLQINGSAKLKLFGYSILGFDEPLTFEITSLPPGVDYSFDPTSFTPTGNTTLTLISTQKIDLNEFNISVTGTGSKSGIKQTIFFTLVLTPEPSGFDLDLSPNTNLKFHPKQTAEILFTIAPTGDFSEEINLTLHGLEDTMAWNSDISPIKLVGETSVQINITGLEEPNVYDLTLEANSNNQTSTVDFSIEVLPAVDDGDPNGNDVGVFTIITVIIILVIIVIIVSWLSTSKSKKKEKQESESLTRKPASKEGKK